MKLGKKQELFTRLSAQHDLWLIENGYGIRSGDAFRDPRVHGEIGEKVGYGHKNSAHKSKLAKDKYLTKNGIYLIKTEDYREAGEHWEKMHSLCRWGGRFADGNHFSLWHNGMM